MSNSHSDGRQRQNFNFVLFPFQPHPLLTVFPLFFFSFSNSAISFPHFSVHLPLPPFFGFVLKFQNIPGSRIELAWNGISKRDNFHDRNAPSLRRSLLSKPTFPPEKKIMFMFCSAASFSFSFLHFLDSHAISYCNDRLPACLLWLPAWKKKHRFDRQNYIHDCVRFTMLMTSSSSPPSYP